MLWVSHIDVLFMSLRSWQHSLARVSACGVAAPAAALARCPQLLLFNQAAPQLLQWRLLLQHYLGLTAGQLYEKQTYLLLPQTRPEMLAQRLQFLDHRGELDRLPAAVSAPGSSTSTSSSRSSSTSSTSGSSGSSGWADSPPSQVRTAAGSSGMQAAAASGLATAGMKPSSRSQWQQRQQQQRPRPLTLQRLVGHSAGPFLAELGCSREEWERFAAEHPAGTCPAWQWVQQEAWAEGKRLGAVLPPDD